MNRQSGYTQEISAAKADISLSSAKRLEKHGFKQLQPRKYKTRKDPIQDDWDSLLVPLLKQKPTLSPITLFDYLQEMCPEKYTDKILRTLQRRVKEWKAKYGKDKEIMFEQQHLPGILGLSDFTELTGITITIRGKLLPHKLYHFRLAYSGWSYIKIILGGESFTALAESFQSALWRLGGSPEEHRTDSLSAAFKNLSKQEKYDITISYSELCNHYNIKPTRNNLGCKHENGSIESSHGHMKRRIKQALILRGVTDFDSIDDYQSFIDNIVQKHNRNNRELINHEKKYLLPLPALKTCDYTVITVCVASTSTIKVKNNVYSVPSRLIGETLKIHLYDDRLDCFLGSDFQFTYKRIRSSNRIVYRHINYKHLLPSLIKKPCAFARSTLKLDILPSQDYIDIWHFLEKKCEKQQACKIIVNLLHLANETNKELEIAQYVKTIIVTNKIPYIELVRKKFRPNAIDGYINNISVQQHELKAYNDLLTTMEEIK